ncbi:MAG: hypothetical protein NZ992_03255 [Candidatus Korarchaeum sp.]|nr:hypothetical protein [Candidatus Korarchaeum sp.]
METSCPEERVVTLLIEARVKELEPVISYENGPSFYSSLNLTEEDCPNLNGVLESLVEKGALRKSKVGSLPSCPNCGSFRLMPKFICPVCESINIRRADAVTHLPCGFVATAEEFNSGDSLRCPKCGKMLRAIGVDYNRLSGVILCESCGKISLSPRLLFECADCRTKASERELVLKPIYKYEVLMDKLLAMRPMLDEVVRILREMEFEVTSPKELVGLSGIVHKFSLSAKGEDEHLIDLVQSENVVSEDKMLSLFGKMVDSFSNEATLVAIPKASEGAKALAKSFKINLIEASSPEEVASKIAERLRRKPSRERRSEVIA